MPYSVDTPPLALVPASQAGVQDKRARFREIYCAVLEARERDVPDYRPCEDALSRVGNEPAGTGRPVDLGPSKRRLIAAVVPGIGYECFEQWLEPPGTAATHVRQFGYDLTLIKVDALSSTANNARQIRDAIMAMPAEAGPPRLVLIGYSKGAPDILEAVVAYPEIRQPRRRGGQRRRRDRRLGARQRCRAIPGRPAAALSRRDLHLGRRRRRGEPAARDAPGVARAITRCRRTCATTRSSPFRGRNASPSILTSSYDKLARIDARNDSQMIFYDQVIPGSTLVGYINADHWALAVPIARIARHDRLVVRDPERLPARGAARGAAALRGGGSGGGAALSPVLPASERVANRSPPQCLPRTKIGARHFVARSTTDRMVDAAKSTIALLSGATIRPDRELDPRLTRAIDYIRANIRSPISLGRVASAVALSESRFRHLFVAETGTSFRAYLLWLRINLAIRAVMAGASWTDAAHEAGFSDSAHLTRTHKRMFGIEPTAIRPPSGSMSGV